MGKQDQTANVDGQQPVNINKGEQKWNTIIYQIV
jgi:hypothetical protein